MQRNVFLTEEQMKYVPLDVQLRIKEECDRIGYVVLKAKRYSDHPDDHYLYTVLARKKMLGETRFSDNFSTWSYNDSTGGLNHGHYYTESLKAEEDYNKRVYLAKNN